MASEPKNRPWYASWFPFTSSSSSSPTSIQTPTPTQSTTDTTLPSKKSILGIWLSPKEEAEKAERKLLSRLPFFSSSHILSVRVSETDENAVMNTFVMDPVNTNTNDGNARELEEPDEPNKNKNAIENGDPIENGAQKDVKALVMCHGFGAGLGFYFKAFPYLRQNTTHRIFALDWLGMGRSGRASLPPVNKDRDQDITEVENYFIESFEKWRSIMGIEKMTLVAHSLGGYLSILYAIKYHHRVEKLILVSPAGIPDPKPESEILEKIPPNRHFLFQFVKRVWDWNITPQSMIRLAGPFGSRLVRNYIQRRLQLSPDEAEDMVAYLHGISRLKGTGEYALSRLLAPFAYARRPLGRRLHELTMPVVYMYGDMDWMDPSVPRDRIARGELSKGSRVEIVPNAGHQLFLDNPEYFSRRLIELIKE